MSFNISAQPSPLFSVPPILESIAATGAALIASPNEASRTALIAQARALITTLETPIEAITRMAWAEPTRYAAVHIAIDLKLFTHLDATIPKTTVELAALTGSSPNLLDRLLRHLAAMSVINEVGISSFTQTRLSHALTVPYYRDAIPFCYDCAGPSILSLPQYFAETGYKSPTENLNGPFQFAHKTALSSWEWGRERKEIGKAFNNHMAGYRIGRSSWMDASVYPVKERLLKGLKTDEKAVLLVDVGGGIGRDVSEFRSKFPGVKGRLILQDQFDLIKTIKNKLDGIEPMGHDFFQPQTIKGARGYYLHSVLHDWPDDSCRMILRNIIEAMEPGYSKILINENVIPDVGASWKATALDLYMMSLASSAERTEKQWRDLLASAGLRVTGIWNDDPGTESLIEAVLEREKL
ncbi:o-methyltransferase [Sclerotinia borealis F-4128]|uniref:O-methyltransferase n=1 Tax=Sclerotinia borealis (strain F-4128) TaxID=1432307 RepID=W9C8S8_SCLBF|nr:o-methyltransferase [Sclerotinia borealis F-4128]